MTRWLFVGIARVIVTAQDRVLSDRTTATRKSMKYPSKCRLRDVSMKHECSEGSHRPKQPRAQARMCRHNHCQYARATPSCDLSFRKVLTGQHKLAPLHPRNSLAIRRQSPSQIPLPYSSLPSFPCPDSLAFIFLPDIFLPDIFLPSSSAHIPLPSLSHQFIPPTEYTGPETKFRSSLCRRVYCRTKTTRTQHRPPSPSQN